MGSLDNDDGRALDLSRSLMAALYDFSRDMQLYSVA